MIARLTISYRGAAYAGWQRQANALAVQQVVEEALERLFAEAGREGRVRIGGASRTDAGVHARGQVAHLALAEPFALRGLVHGGNRHLPEDVRILAADEVREGFDARRSALGKEYRYRMISTEILSPLDALFAIPAPRGLEVERLRAASQALLGRHDFSAFELAGGTPTDPQRTIRAAAWVEDGERLEFRIEGESFLRGMVRGIVGTLLEVGTGRRSRESFEQLLAGAPRARAGPTAPARGLTLERVDYAADWAANGEGPVASGADPMC